MPSQKIPLIFPSGELNCLGDDVDEAAVAVRVGVALQLDPHASARQRLSRRIDLVQQRYKTLRRKLRHRLDYRLSEHASISDQPLKRIIGERESVIWPFGSWQ